MMRRKLAGNEGFSLLEVLISLSILAVGLLALALFQVTAIKGNSIASKMTAATQLTQDRLESFRRIPWANITSSPAAGYNTGTWQPQDANIVANAGDNNDLLGTRYYRVWFVRNDSATLKTIVVWTCWQDDQSIWHNVMLTTQRVNIGGV
jgi:prepilin-type N-terminal cleavage/methylation domain-containing protein